MRTLREWLRAEKARRNLSERAISYEADLPLATIQSILGKETFRPKKETLAKLATWGGVTLEYLWDLTHGTPPGLLGPDTNEPFCLKTISRIFEQIDQARATLPADILAWLDPWLDERGIVDEERLNAYEIAARICREGKDGADAADRGGGWSDRDRRRIAECCELPPR